MKLMRFQKRAFITYHAYILYVHRSLIVIVTNRVLCMCFACILNVLMEQHHTSTTVTSRSTDGALRIIVHKH